MTLSASNPFWACTRWRAIVRATSGDYLGQWDTSSQSMEREFGVRIKPAESFYGSLAKTFLEMLTTLRQMLRRTFWCLRILPQVSRCLPWRLWEFPQVSRRLPWRLRVLPQVSRRLPWCLRVLPQVLRRLLWGLRVLPQVSWRLLWRLRVLPQERFSPFGRLQDCCKHFQRHFGRYNMLSETCSMNKGISFFCRTHVMDSIGTLA